MLRRRGIVRRELPRIATAVGVSLLPLPILVPLNFMALGGLHDIVARVLPATLSTALIVGQALVLAVAMGLTYASVPLLAERQRRALLEAS